MECLVENEHWYDLNNHKWYHYYCGINDKYTYPTTNIKGKIISLHKYVYQKFIGKIHDDMIVDHVKSGEFLDVRFSNLILVENYNKKIQLNVGKNLQKNINISEDIITKEYIINIKKIKDLQNVIKTKKLNVMNGGTISIDKINRNNFETHKLLIIESLYPSGEKIKNSNKFNYDDIPEDIITKDYVLGVSKINILKSIILIKKLNFRNGGKIKIDDIDLKTFDYHKQLVIDTLFGL